MLNYTVVKNWNFPEIKQSYTRRDTMLYALSMGLGADPLDMGQLQYVYEKELRALPTMACVLGWAGSCWSDPRIGADYLRLVHGEQHLRIYRTLPVEANLLGREQVLSLTDLGAGKGAIARIERQLFDSATDELLAECTNVIFLRGDGGFSQGDGTSDPRPSSLPGPPDRPPDIETEFTSLPQAALIYRLNGDYNPLHADPEVARNAGFPRPILHGLCTFGMAGVVVLKTCCAYKSELIKSIAVRFTAPVYPGDTLRFSIWHALDGTLHFRAHVDARQKMVLDHGVVEFNF